jgi:NAD-dependent SIR2 family protein deacetylase
MGDEQAVDAIRSAEALLITAGAGMGVDSGLPDFRGNEGFWKAYPAVAKLGLSFAQLANPQWFQNNPKLAWAFYGHRLNLYRQTQPHVGFNTLLRWADKMAAGYFVFTSNVDGHFQKAGFDTNRIVECHGSINHFQCVENCTNEIWDAVGENILIDEKNFHACEPFPKCHSCKRIARPNILMFNDFSWLHQRSQEQEKRFADWLISIKKRSARLVVIELGAGTAIPTVRHTSERIADNFHGKLIRINPREFGVPDQHHSLDCGALAGIQRLVIALVDFAK